MTATAVKPATTVAPERMLQPIVKKNGFIYKLVKRSEKVAIYSQHYKESGGVAGGPANFGGVKSFIEPNEVFPGNEAFGKTAFCVTNMERAEVRFNELEGMLVDETEPIEETTEEETIEE